jgi:hypothetical protein
MAIEKDIKINVEDRDALASIGNIDDGLQGLDKSADKGAKGVAGVSKAFKGLGTAIKAAGIGLVIGALAKLSEVFMQNQKVADLFNTTFEVLSIAFNDFVNFIIDNFGTVSDFFKDIFENPVDNIKAFGKAIKENIIERFNSALKTLGFLSSAVKKVFSGDFAGALEDVKSAGKESIDVLTGVNDSFDKGKAFVEESTEAISKYATETIKAAKENVNLANSAELAAVKNQGLIEEYDRQAEQLRQIRDDESKSIEDRIKANEDLAKVLDKQEEAMLKNAEIQVAAAAAELSKNKNSIELQKAYLEALNEQAAIEAQITGFRSEQQTNVNSLLREQKDIQKELALIGKSERDVEREELKQQYEEQKELINKQVSDDAERKAILLESERVYNEQLKELNAQFIQEDLDAQKEKLEQEKQIAEQERQLEKQKIQDKQMVLDAIGQFADAETGIGKALLIAKQALALKETLMDVKRITFKGTQAVSEAGVNAAQNVSESSKIGFPQNIITIAAAIAQGISIIGSVKKAVSKTKAKASGAVASTPTAPTTPSTTSIPPAFNIVGASGTSQLAEAIGEQEQQPVQAYVVANDVTTAQSMDRNIVEGASIG